MCHNVVELVKSNTKYCCRQPDIMGDKFLVARFLKRINICRQPDIMGDKSSSGSYPSVVSLVDSPI